MGLKASLALLLSSSSLVLGGAATNPSSKHLSAGALSGSKCPKSDATAFRGIPYAQPPTKERRFLPPQELSQGYKFPGGSLNATRDPPPCIQWGSGFGWEKPQPSEDCLYLSVFVPSNSNAALPVKVFAYGGSNTGGAMNYPLYDSCALASDSIVVTFNYRMGPLGFLTLPDGAKGNMAIQDYVAALRWVHNNIEAFGGDKGKVLLFGQSSGADDAFTVAALPEVKELISAVALESGGGRDLVPLKNAQASGEVFASKLGCHGANQLECLQTKSVKELQAGFQAAQTTLAGKPLGVLNVKLGIQPPNGNAITVAVLDGDFIKTQPLKTGSQVPILAGANQQDAALFTLLSYVLGSNGPITASTYDSFLKQWGPAQKTIQTHYPLDLFRPPHQGNPSNKSEKVALDEEAVIAGISHVATMAGYVCPNYRALRSTALAGKSAYAYRFNHTDSCPWLVERAAPFPGPKIAKVLGATHTAELPLVFANLDNQPFGNGSCSASEADRGISKALVEAWTNMAAKGNPLTDKVQWPALAAGGNCDLSKPKGLLVQQDGVETGEINFKECELWDKIWVQMGGVDVPWVGGKTGCAGNGTTSGSGSGSSSSGSSSGSSGSGSDGSSSGSGGSSSGTGSSGSGTGSSGSSGSDSGSGGSNQPPHPSGAPRGYTAGVAMACVGVAIAFFA